MKEAHPRPSWMGRSALVLAAFPAFLGWSWAGADQVGGEGRLAIGPAVTAPALDVQGTIEATIEGERITFYSVSGESGGRPYSSSTWMDLPSGGRMVALGGFVTPEPPFDAFEWGAVGMPTSYGSYDGPVFGIGIPMAGEATSFTITLPGGGAGAMVSYQPTASLDDVTTTTYMLQTGTLTVTEIGVSAGVAHATGTFAGTFRMMAGEASVEITEGSFSVEGIPGLDTLRPPGDGP